MHGRMVFGDIVADIDSSGFPEMAKFALSCSEAKPMETHVRIFEAFAGNVVGETVMRRCIVSLHGRELLFVAHFFKSMAGGNGLAAVDEEGVKFGLCIRVHDTLDGLVDDHDGSVVGWCGSISGHEKMYARSTPSLQF